MTKKWNSCAKISLTTFLSHYVACLWAPFNTENTHSQPSTVCTCRAHTCPRALSCKKKWTKNRGKSQAVAPNLHQEKRSSVSDLNHSLLGSTSNQLYDFEHVSQNQLGGASTTVEWEEHLPCTQPTWVLIPASHLVPQTLPEVITEYRTRSNPWASPGVAKKQTKRNNNKIKSVRHPPGLETVQGLRFLSCTWPMWVWSMAPWYSPKPPKKKMEGEKASYTS